MNKGTKTRDHASAQTDLARARPSSGAIDDLLARSVELWRETSLDRLVMRLASVLVEEYGVARASFLEFKGRGQTLALSPAAFELPMAAPLAPELIGEAEAQLKMLNLMSQEYRDGVNHLVVGGAVLHFATLGEPSAQWCVLFWHAPVDGAAGEATFDIALEFLVRQAQNTVRWIGRFDKTQALLHRDDLTGLYNARYLEITLAAEIRRVMRYQTSFSLLFIDLDNFKPINDEHGHLAGSAVLRQVADALREGLREVDAVFRYGGDEFVVVLLETTGATAAMAAERIRRRIETTPFRVEGGAHASLTCSIGVAACPEHATTKEALLGLADQCMYKSKRNGKNRVVIVGREATAALEAPVKPVD